MGQRGGPCSLGLSPQTGAASPPQSAKPRALACALFRRKCPQALEGGRTPSGQAQPSWGGLARGHFPPGAPALRARHEAVTCRVTR